MLFNAAYLWKGKCVSKMKSSIHIRIRKCAKELFFPISIIWNFIKTICWPSYVLTTFRYSCFTFKLCALCQSCKLQFHWLTHTWINWPIFMQGWSERTRQRNGTRMNWWEKVKTQKRKHCTTQGQKRMQRKEWEADTLAFPPFLPSSKWNNQ